MLSIAIVLGVLVVVAIVLVLVGMAAPEAKDPIQERLAEFSVREEPMTLEEIELSQAFYQRVILPFFNKIGQVAQRFTPQATLESTRRKLEMGGNPMQMDPAFFLTLRFVFAVLFAGVIVLVYITGHRPWLQHQGECVGLGVACHVHKSRSSGVLISQSA